MRLRRLLIVATLAGLPAGLTGIAHAGLEIHVGDGDGIGITTNNSPEGCDPNTGHCDPDEWRWACASPTVKADDVQTSSTVCLIR
jgi:hypothetical protein